MIPLDLAEVLRRVAGSADAPSVAFGDDTRTLADELAAGDALVDQLLAHGVRPEDRVAVYDTTSPLVLRALYAAAVVGAVLVPLNFRWSREEVLAVLDDAAVTVVVVGPGAPHDLADAARVVREEPSREPVVRRQVEHREILVQMYTSGTTGRPKGVLISHDNLVGKFLREPNPWDIGSASVVLACMPLFHIGGLGWLVGALVRSADVVVAETAAPAMVLGAVRRHDVTHVFLVPAALAALVGAPGDSAMPSLTTIAYGASPMESWLLAAVMERWDVDFVQGYGLTETTGQVVSLSGADHRAWRFRTGPWPVGRPDPGVEVAVRPVGDGDGVDGLDELLVRGPQVAMGYRGIGPVTDADGWFATGDLGRVDADGYVYVLDRVKDLIISGGENVMPAEIEQLLEGSGLVREAAVVAVPSERWGEVPLALVVGAAELGPDDVEQLHDLCRNRLAAFKRPAGIEVVAELPRNAVGKILKRELRDAWDAWRPVEQGVRR